MQYFYSVTDKYGNIHSIDNLVFIYNIKDLGQKGIDKCIQFCKDLSEKHGKSPEYWERLNVNACTKYQWYNNHIHLCNGIYLSIGKYVEIVQNERKNNKDYYVMPLIKLEINPNKHFDNPLFTELNEWLRTHSGSIELYKYDYAIDIPVPLDAVQVFGTRKEKGLYKGTRYFGQRNKNGYCKIYNKQKEQGLENPLTRVEHTITSSRKGSYNKKTEKISFENIYFKSGKDASDSKQLNSTYQCIVNMAKALQVNGLSFDEYIDKLDKRIKQKIREAIAQESYTRLDFDQSILDDLLAHVKENFDYKEPEPDVYEDEEGFLQLSDNAVLPFD